MTDTDTTNTTPAAKGTDLQKSLDLLKSSVDKSNSLTWAFLMGVVRGVGAVIGASVVAGLLLGWAATTFDTAENIPVIGPLFDSVGQVIPENSPADK